MSVVVVRRRGNTTNTVPEEKSTGKTILIIVLVVLALVVIGVGIWYFFLRRSTSTTNGTCNNDSNCTSPQVCDPASKTCRSDVGGSCTSNANCVADTSCVNNVCGGNYGSFCGKDADCATPGICSFGKCTTSGNACNVSNTCVMPGITLPQVKCFDGTCGLNAGEPCTLNSNCTTDELCDTFASPVQCRVTGGNPCSQGQCLVGATCVSGECTYKICSRDSDCFAGTYCANKICIPSTCTDDIQCQVEYGLGGNFNCVADGGGGLRCVSSGTECPDECVEDNVTCNGSICKNETGAPCGSSFECQTGICNQTLPSPVCANP